jgi:hypothetical protein
MVPFLPGRVGAASSAVQGCYFCYVPGSFFRELPVRGSMALATMCLAVLVSDWSFGV